MAPGRMRNCRSTSAAASTLMAGELACLFGVSARHEVVCKLTICPEPGRGMATSGRHTKYPGVHELDVRQTHEP